MAGKKGSRAPTDAKASAARKRRRVNVKAGQMLGLPLRDGTFALAHVALFDRDMTCVLFARRAGEPGRLLKGFDGGVYGGPIAVMELPTNCVESGDWPVIATRLPAYSAEMLDTSGAFYGPSMAVRLLEAYYGLRPWDESRDPRLYEKLLLPGVPLPPTIRFKADFEREAAAALPAAAAEEPVPQAAASPASVRLRSSPRA
jgi:hypothetical protein